LLPFVNIGPMCIKTVVDIYAIVLSDISDDKFGGCILTSEVVVDGK